MTEQKPPVITLKMTPAGVEFTIGALRKLPHEQVHDLVNEVWNQYQEQMKALAAAQEEQAPPSAPEGDAAEPVTH